MQMKRQDYTELESYCKTLNCRRQTAPRDTFLRLNCDAANGHSRRLIY